MRSGSALLALAIAAAIPLVWAPGAAAVTTFTVNDVGDTGDANCDGADCTLRDAIDHANLTANSGGPDVIEFASAGMTIAVTAALPPITEAVVIDGFGSGAPDTEIDGAAVPGSADGLRIDNGGSVVQDVAIFGFGTGPTESLIWLNSNGNIVRNSYVGLERDGSTSVASNFGIRAFGNDNVVGGALAADGNVVGGQNVGVRVEGDGNAVYNNRIGTDAAGGVARPNGIGVDVVSAPNTTIGGPGLGNLVSGNASGVFVDGSFSTNTVIMGNRVGTNAAGSGAVANGVGIYTQGEETVIGGPAPGQGNLVSGNTGTGINSDSSDGGTAAVIQGNVVGLTPSQGAVLGNGAWGIQVAMDDVTVGGSQAGEGNVVGGNFLDGVSVCCLADGVEILGNRIGISEAGALRRNNGSGIAFEDGTNTVIGGFLAGQANRIVGNGAEGIVSTSPPATDFEIRHNFLFGNGTLGDSLEIDLLDDGPDPLDFPDADGKQNRPVLTSAETGSGGTLVTGTLQGEPLSGYRIEVYSNSTCAAGEPGEGQQPESLGSVGMSAGGTGSFSFSIPAVQAGRLLAATATKLDPPRRTSEFSFCQPVTVPSGAGGGGEEQLPPPVAGKTVNAEPVGGTVTFRCRGQGERPLAEAEQLPVSCVIDARRGRVRIISAAGGGATQAAVFYDGAFRVKQKPGRGAVTEMALVGRLERCGGSGKKKAGRRSARASAKRRGRRLWGSGKGRFRSKGRYSSATVRGTKWLVHDRCDRSTLTKVAQGRVLVRDFARRKSVTLKKGGSYVARPRPRGRFK